MNLQIPLIENLADWYTDSEGWITTMDPKIKGVVAAIADALDLPKTSPQLLYSSMIGLPVTRGGNTSLTSLTTDSTEAKLDRIKEDLFGPDIVSTQSLFNFETSYMYANCSLAQAVPDAATADLSNATTVKKTNWGISAGQTVSNGDGLTIAYNE